MKIKPFIKYCGGKTKLLPNIMENIPVKYNTYFEPFVGGGSVIFELINNFTDSPSEASLYISDINRNLIQCYNIIKNNVDKLIVELSKTEYKNEKDVYLQKRERYNVIKFSEDENVIEQVALFIYLNKCGYNGMHRLNKAGKFNIPFGSMKNPTICDDILLKGISEKLKNVNISCNSYQAILELTSKDDLVYLDPPYHDTFTDYTNNVFGEQQQCELKVFVDKLTEKGVNVILSNSATEFIKDLYKNYTIINLTTKYSLGGKGANRGDKQEVLIKNY